MKSLVILFILVNIGYSLELENSCFKKEICYLSDRDIEVNLKIFSDLIFDEEGKVLIFSFLLKNQNIFLLREAFFNLNLKDDLYIKIGKQRINYGKSFLFSLMKESLGFKKKIIDIEEEEGINILILDKRFFDLFLSAQKELKNSIIGLRLKSANTALSCFLKNEKILYSLEFSKIIKDINFYLEALFKEKILDYIIGFGYFKTDFSCIFEFLEDKELGFLFKKQIIFEFCDIEYKMFYDITSSKVLLNLGRLNFLIKEDVILSLESILNKTDQYRMYFLYYF